MTRTRKSSNSAPRDQLRAIGLTAVMLLSIVSGIPFAGSNGIATADHGGDVEFESLVIDVNGDFANITGTLQGDDTTQVDYLYFQLQKEDGNTIGGNVHDFAIVPNESSLTAGDIEDGASEIDNIDKVLELDQADSITDFDLREIDDFPAGQTDKIDKINFKIYEKDNHDLLHEITLSVGDKLSSGDDLIESDEIATSNDTAESADFDSAITVDDSVNVTGGPYENGTVSIDRGFDSDTDELAVNGAADESSFQEIAYDSTTGELAVVPDGGSATAAEYEQLFRNVTYNHTDDRPDTAEREITFSLTTNASAKTDAVYNPQTGHWYEQVDGSGITWDDARDAAADRGGYLATVTSAEENAFIRDRVRGEGWLGATDAAAEGEWHWVTGPEGDKNTTDDLKGVEFFNQTSAHVAWTDPYPAPPAGVPGGGEAVNGEYANWNPRHEPNNKFPFRGGEDYAYFSHGTPGNTQDGQWLDGSADSPNFNPEGYIVEYDESPVSGDADVLNASRNVTYIAADSEPPTADASATNPTEIDDGESVTFDGSDSSNADFYEWDIFGDETTDLTGSAPEYTFTNPGTYEVNLTVTNASSGLTDSDTIEITVANIEKPNVVLNAPDEAERGDNVQFDGTNSTDSVGIESFEWDFGDGAVSNDVSPVHGYSETGTYTVELNVTDVAGNYNTTTHEISIVESPRPKIDDFELTSPASEELNISFTSNTSLDTITVEIFDSDEVTPSPDDSDARLFNITGSDVDESSSDGNYTYTNTTSVNEGNYTARLTIAENSDGRDGGFGQESETTVSAPTDTTGPPAPTNPSATAIADGNITISFDDVNESTVEYTIYRNNTSTSAGFENVTTVDDNNSANYTYTDSGLIDGTTYEYNVSATDDDGNEGPTSTTVSATADATAPTISDGNFSLTNQQNRDLNVTFTSDEQLTAIDVGINDSDGNTVTNLTTGDFTETNNGDGTYTYTNTSSAPSDGTYEATLTNAEDDAGNDGSSGENDTLTVSTATPATFSSGYISENTPEKIELEFDQAVNVTNDTTGFTVKVNGTTQTIAGATNASDAETNVTLELADYEIVADDNVSVSYDGTSDNLVNNDGDDTEQFSVNTDEGAEFVNDAPALDTTAPSISEFDASNTGQDVTVTFDSDEPLATIDVQINDSDETTVTTLTSNDFDETNNDGTYTYTNTSSVPSDGTYEATLANAEDDAGNDGASGENDTVTVDTAVNFTLQSGNITAGSIAPGNEADYSVDIAFPADNEAGSLNVTLAGSDGSTVTTAVSISQNAGTVTVAAIDASALDDGSVDVIANFTDDAGNTEQATTTVTKDTGVNFTLSSENITAGSITPDNQSSYRVDVAFPADNEAGSLNVTLAGPSATTVTNDSVSVSQDAGTVTVAAIDASALGDGSVDVIANFTDDAGNVEQANTTVTKDTTGPPAPTNPSATAIAGGNITISFDDVNESTVEYTIYRNNTSTAAGFESVTTVTDNNSSQYTYTDTGATDGTTYEYKLAATDDAGNEGPNSTTVTATADATAPEISDSNFSLTNPENRELNITFTSDEQLATIDVEINDSDGNTVTNLTIGDFTKTNNGDGTYTYSNTSLVSSDGSYEAALTNAEDDAGNDGVSDQNGTITVDTTGPPAPTNPSATAIAGGNITISFDDVNESTVSYTIYRNNTSTAAGFESVTTVTDDNSSSYTYTDTGAIDETTYEYNVSAINDAGTEGANASTDPVTADATAPTIGEANVSLPNPQDRDLTLTFTSDERVENISVSISGADSATLTESDFNEIDNQNGTYTYEATYSGSSDGDYTVTLDRAEDAAGNDGSSAESETVTVDTTAPSISSFTVSNPSDQDVNVSFTATEEVTNLNVSISGAETATLTESAFIETENGGNYTYEATYSGSSDGDYTATLDTAEDADGNGDNSGQSDTVTVDTDVNFTLQSENITAGPVTASNESSYRVAVAFPADNEAGNLNVTLVGSDGSTVATDSVSISQDAGTVTVTGIDAANLDDGSVDVIANFTDDAGNTEQATTTVTKDTTPPSISDESLTIENPRDRELNVTFTSNESLATIDVEINDSDDNTVTTLTSGDFTKTHNGDGTYTYTNTSTMSSDGTYEATLTNAEDDAGNDGADGQSDTITVSTATPATFGSGYISEDTPEKIELEFNQSVNVTAADAGFTVEVNGTERTFTGVTNSSSAETNVTLELADYEIVADDNVSVHYDGTSNNLVNNDGDETEQFSINTDEDSEFVNDAPVPDTIAPSISSFDVSNPSRQNVVVSFDSDEPLSTIEVQIDDSDATPVTTLTSNDFDETENDGTYTYTNTSSVTADGAYEVTLTTAEDAAGNDGASEQTATVTIDTVGPTAPQNVTATAIAGGNITISFDDVNESTVQYTIYRNNTSTAAGFENVTTVTDGNSANYTYTDSGLSDGTSYEYIVSAADDVGNEGSNSTTVSATADATAPTAAAGSDQTVENGTEVIFDGTNSTDNVEIDSYEWDIGANGSVDLTGSEPFYTFGSTGTYTAKLTVTDAAGNNDTDLVNITVIPSISSFNVSNPSDRAVNVSFNVDTQLSNINVTISGAENETVTEDDFTETDNGDGTYTYEATYSGSNDGNYTATLESAEDTNGNDGGTGQSGSVVLDADLVSDITADSALVSLDSDVLFDAERSSIPTDATPSYEWRIDGTVESTEPNFTHTFDTTGDHTVELTIEADGATDTDEVTITVKDRQPPVIKLTVNDTEPLVNDTVHFDATDSTDNDDIDSYDWEITGDGTIVDDGDGEYKFTYEVPGTFRETVTVTDESGNEADRTVKITVQGPNASVDADSIEYGTTTLNSSNVTSITVSNDGTTPLNLTKASFNDPNGPFSLAGDAATSLPVIQPGSSRSIAVAFEPTMATTNQTSLTIEHNATHLADITVDLNGTGVKSNLSVDDSSQAFGEVSIGQSNTRTVTITNEGDETIEITDLTIAGSTPEAFEIVDNGDLPGTLRSNESVSIDVAFDPVRSGEQTATLLIESVDGTVTTVSLNGTGSGPEIVLPDGDIDFGEVGPGNETSETIRIANYGSKPLDIDSVSVTGADSSAFTVENAPDNVPAGKTATVDVTFAPEDTGNHTATLAVDSNDTAAGTIERDLNGSAVAPAIDADPRNVDFGNVSIGETVSFNITVQNLHTSKSNLSIESIGITGENPGEFAVSNGSKAPFSLEPSESKDIQVNFTPSSKGTKEAQLQIMSNAGNEPQLDVWLSNTKTYVVVQETATDVNKDSSTVNLDANHVQSGDSFSINVSKPGTREHNASIDTIKMSTSYDGDFEMNITAQESPSNHTLDETDRETVQYIEQSYTVNSSVFDNTSFEYRVSKDTLPSDASSEDVTFHRYNTTQDAWVTHESTLERTTSGSYLFSVDTPGFSELAVSVPDADATDSGGSNSVDNSGGSDGTDDSGGSDGTDGLDGTDDSGGSDGSDDPDGSDTSDTSAGSDGSTGSDSDGDTGTSQNDDSRNSVDDDTASADDDGGANSGIGLPQLSPIAWGIGGLSMFSALLGLLFMLGRQRAHPHRIAVLSGVDDRWTKIAATVGLRERDLKELADDVAITSIGTGQHDDSNAWLSSDGIAGLPWLSADSTLEPLESVDISEYETIVVIGALPAAFDGVDERNLIRWSVPEVSTEDFDADQLYEQIREDAHELFSSLEGSPGSADAEDM